MKNLFIIILSISMASCAGSKTVRDSKKVIKGNWTLSSISYNETGIYNATLFNDASKNCFEGSTWQFIPNNNTGVYTINNNTCSIGERHFVFTIQEIDQATGLYDFLLKPTNKKGKSDTNQGFRLRLNALSDNNMQWHQTVMVDNKPLTLIMNFTKQ
ncbi:MAG: lipocalin family protein [Xanthomarina sp.]